MRHCHKDTGQWTMSRVQSSMRVSEPHAPFQAAASTRARRNPNEALTAKQEASGQYPMDAEIM
jgi:hypothetical protein